MPIRPPTIAPLSRTRSIWITLIVLCGGLAISALISIRARLGEEERILGNFREHANYQLFAARERVRLLEELTYGLKRAISGQTVLERQEFTAICQDILNRFGGVQSLQWVENVSADRRSEVEARLRDDYGRPIPFKSRIDNSGFAPVGEQDHYWVIRYAEPVEANAMVLGYDVSSAPTAPALQLAKETDALVVTHPFRLAQATSDTEDFGIIFICPVIKPADNGPQLLGFAQAVFRVGDVFGSTILNDDQRALRFYLLDIDPATGQSQQLFSSAEPGPSGRIAPITTSDPDERVSTDIKIGGRDWRFVAVIDPDWRTAQRTNQPQIMLIGGSTLTLLAVLVLLGLLRRARVVEVLVAERTRELRTSEGELRAILDFSPNAIWIKDLEGRYVLTNKEFGRIYARAPEDLIGCTDEVLYDGPIDQEMRNADLRALHSDSHVLVEGTYEILGQMRHYYTVKFPVRRADGSTFGVGGIATDVTTFKQVEAQLAETQKLESLGVLAGGIAHDFNNLLTGILGNASLINLDHPCGTPTGQSGRDIETAAKRAAELCRQMLAYSGRGSFMIERLELSTAVQEMVPLLRSSIGKQTDLRLTLAAGLPNVEVDPSQLRQIIMNLVINASEALPATGGRVDVSTKDRQMSSAELQRAIGHPALPTGRYLSFKVQDTGSGIAEADLRRIFEPFFTTKFTGRGLGLAAVLGIVRSHHGALLVDSTPGLGTTFELLLPVPANASTELAPTLRPARLPATGLAGLRVFLVEDEAVVQDFVSKRLAQVGAEVTAFANGDEAAARFEATPTDFAILDLTLPGRSGQELLALVRAIRPNLPVLMISGFSEQEAAGHCGDRKPDAFLQKPFSAEELTHRIESLIHAEAD